MSIQDPGYRPSEWGTLSDHEKRIRALEALGCCVSASGGQTYPEAVLLDECLLNVWPADESSGNLIDRFGSRDLTAVPDTIGAGGTYPQYAAAGPFTGLPAYTAVLNAGAQGNNDSPRFEYQDGGNYAPFQGTSPWTIEGWYYPITYTLSELFYMGSGGTSIQIYWTASKLNASRGSVNLTDPDNLPTGAWQLIHLVYTGAVLQLWRNANLIDSDAAAASETINGSTGWLNVPDTAATGPPWYPFNGRGVWLAFYNCAFDAAKIAERYALQASEGNAADGWVWTSDGAGGASWQPPTIEVEF